jgi:hypothetical protein
LLRWTLACTAALQVFLFLNAKCKRLFNNKLKASKLAWTALYRKAHKKVRVMASHARLVHGRGGRVSPWRAGAPSLQRLLGCRGDIFARSGGRGHAARRAR